MPSPRPLLPFRLLPLLAVLVCLLVSATSHADELTDNAALLKSAADFRVRTQAALALGASRSERAVAPLCRGLEDEHRVVRLAAATAIARLNSGGAGCVRARIAAEKDETVLAALQKTLARLEGALEPAEPAIDGSTKFYVAIGSLKGLERYSSPVRGAMVRTFAAAPGWAVAPKNETNATATGVLKAHPNARGVQLKPSLKPLAFSEGTLTVTIAVAVVSYPSLDILADYSQSAKMGGVAEGDDKAVEELVVAVAESAAGRFLKLVPTLDL